MEEGRLNLRGEVDLTSLCLDGDRIRLRPIDETYASGIFEEFTEKITRYMFPRPAENIEEVLGFISASVKGMEDCRELVFVILKKEGEEFLGCCGFHGKENPRTPELGIWLKKGAHGNKYGMEAINVIVHWAVKNVDFEYLRYPVDRANIPSRKIAESLGGIIYEENRVETMSGGILDEVVYKITKEE